MNKRKFARVMALHRDGVPKEVCTQCIISMCNSPLDSVLWIDKFYREIYDKLVEELKCSNCQVLHPGKLILVDKVIGKSRCIKCGRFIPPTISANELREGESI
jgi:hypothetical protein